MASFPVNSKKNKEKKEDNNSSTYTFVFRHKDMGFGNYEDDKFAINNSVQKQLDGTSKLTDKKIFFSKIDTSPFLEDTKITIKSKNVDRKTAQKIAEMNGWTFLE